MIVEQADWSTAIHLRSDRDGELRYSSFVPIEDRLYNAVWTPRGSHTRIISRRKANGREIGMNEKKLNLVRPTPEEEEEIAAQLADDPDTCEWSEEDWANAQTTQALFPETHEWAVR